MDEHSQELFAKTFEDQQEPLFRYLYMLLGNVSETEDLTQECFLRLNQELKAKRPIDNVKGWLFRTGHNLAIDHHRRQQRSPQDRPEDAAIGIPDKAQLSPEIIFQRERTQLIRTAVGRLSLQQRTCLRLRAEGLRYREIAQVLGVTEGTVCEHIRRGLARLRTDLLEMRL